MAVLGTSSTEGSLSPRPLRGESIGRHRPASSSPVPDWPTPPRDVTVRIVVARTRIGRLLLGTSPSRIVVARRLSNQLIGRNRSCHGEWPRRAARNCWPSRPNCSRPVVHGTRMDDVADVVRLNKATVYHYYASKVAHPCSTSTAARREHAGRRARRPLDTAGRRSTNTPCAC